MTRVSKKPFSFLRPIADVFGGEAYGLADLLGVSVRDLLEKHARRTTIETPTYFYRINDCPMCARSQTSALELNAYGARIQRLLEFLALTFPFPVLRIVFPDRFGRELLRK